MLRRGLAVVVAALVFLAAYEGLLVGVWLRYPRVPFEVARIGVEALALFALARALGPSASGERLGVGPRALIRGLAVGVLATAFEWLTSSCREGFWPLGSRAMGLSAWGEWGKLIVAFFLGASAALPALVELRATRPIPSARIGAKPGFGLVAAAAVGVVAAQLGAAHSRELLETGSHRSAALALEVALGRYGTGQPWGPWWSLGGFTFVLATFSSARLLGRGLGTQIVLVLGATLLVSIARAAFPNPEESFFLACMYFYSRSVFLAAALPIGSTFADRWAQRLAVSSPDPVGDDAE